MRLAIISDIHGNYVALEAVLSAIRQEGVDDIICLGDIATIGPEPQRVMRALAEMQMRCVLGNHDAALLEPERALEYQVAGRLLPTLDWCAQQLSSADFAYLKTLVPTLELPLEGADRLLCYHGSPRAHTDLILATTPVEEIEELCAFTSAKILAGGHTHVQMLRQQDGRLIINPGSVGSAFPRPATADQVPALLPWAEYAIVTAVNGRLSVNLQRIPFDINLFLERLAATDIPIKDWWMQQYSRQ